MVFEHPKVKELLDKTRVLWALHHAESVLSWDSETYMPRKGVADRSLAMAELAALQQKLLLRDDVVKLVDDLSNNNDLNDYEKGVVRVLSRSIRIMKALPPELVMEMAKTTEEARPYWREAKVKNKFEVFEPYLDKIIELSRKAAEYIGYDEHPYDAALDYYEEGLRKRSVEDMFNYIEPRIRRILDKILSNGLYPSTHELEDVKYDVSAMEKVNKEVLQRLGYPFDRGRLDVSAHPFTIGIGLDDVRITTRYEGKDFKRTLYGTIHEFGHALYDLQIDKSFRMTPIARGASLGIHESQSRFWENIIGRSKPFTEAIYPLLSSHLSFISRYSPEDIYMYVNTVKPSLIRVEADEVTYNLHILLRFKLEVRMMEGDYRARDVAEAWNEEMEELLGVRPKTYSEGVLQDIHWSMGSIGYFPTYTIGNLVSAQIYHNIKKDIPNFHDLINELDFEEVRNYLREKIHKWGATYPPEELLKKSFGEPLNPKYFIDYLEEKYLS